MSNRPRNPPIAKPVDFALRELANAMQRLAMYPPGHGLAVAAVAALHEKIGAALLERDALMLGITPRGLLIDGLAVEPLPAVLRDLAVRLHRKNIGTIHIVSGVSADELSTMTAAMAAPDAESSIGVNGLRLTHVRVEPLTYDVLEFADPLADRELDDLFWMQLVEAAFGRRLAETEGVPSVAQIAEAITERARTLDGARRVYEALSGFSTALAARSERTSGSARRRFVDVLLALSRPTTTQVMAGAPSASSRRRFLRETLVLVPPALLMQLLESVADADGEPISPQLRWLLGKLAGGHDAGEMTATSAFAAQVASLVEQWEGVGRSGIDDDESEPRLSVEGMRVVAMGLEIARHTPVVVDAARSVAEHGRLSELLQLLDHPSNDQETARQLIRHVLQPGLLERLLATIPTDFPLVERVATQAGADSVPALLDALSSATDRTARRRLLDILSRVAPEAEEELISRLDGAPWYLARNIFAVLAQLPEVRNVTPILEGMRDPDARVRQEALKAGLRQPTIRDRAVHEAIECNDPGLTRIALAALERTCPPTLVAPVLSVLAHDDEELQLLAVNLLAHTQNPLVVPSLLTLVRTRGGIFRRTRLAHRSPVMLAALRVLARRWSNHRPVVPVLQLAARSSDNEIRAALERERE